jgi:hypothetical protein
MDMRHKARPGSGTAHRPAYEVGAYTLDTFRVLCRVCNTGRSTRPDRIRALPHISRDLLLAAPACCAWPTGASGAVWVAEPFLRASGACAVAAGQERWRLPQAAWCAGFAVVQVLARPGCAVSPLPPAHPALDEAMLNAGRGARPGPPPHRAERRWRADLWSGQKCGPPFGTRRPCPRCGGCRTASRNRSSCAL